MQQRKKSSFHLLMKGREKYDKGDADFSLEVLKIRTTMQGGGAFNYRQCAVNVQQMDCTALKEADSRSAW